MAASLKIQSKIAHASALICLALARRIRNADAIREFQTEAVHWQKILETEKQSDQPSLFENPGS